MKQIQYTPASYWDRRYREGRTSGAGSEGDEGAYKARYVSDFTHNRDVKSVIDWGCGDGQVLELMRFPRNTAYLGVDVSPVIVQRMSDRFVSPYAFMTLSDYEQRNADLVRRLQENTPHEIDGHGVQYRLALSMDVLFHLPDDADYFAYLDNLFHSASRYVIIYSTNTPDGRTARHVFRRAFTPDIEDRFPDWELTIAEPPMREGLASFFVYEKVR